MQLHEFETFYFADTDNFLEIDHTLASIKAKITQINQEFKHNPESINNSYHTAPSKRIEQFFKSVELKYKKPLYAGLYAQQCDIKILLNKCQHFNDWINKILNLVKHLQ